MMVSVAETDYPVNIMQHMLGAHRIPSGYSLVQDASGASYASCKKLRQNTPCTIKQTYLSHNIMQIDQNIRGIFPHLEERGLCGREWQQDIGGGGFRDSSSGVGFIASICCIVSASARYLLWAFLMGSLRACWTEEPMAYGIVTIRMIAVLMTYFCDFYSFYLGS